MRFLYKQIDFTQWQNRQFLKKSLRLKWMQNASHELDDVTFVLKQHKTMKLQRYTRLTML